MAGAGVPPVEKLAGGGETRFGSAPWTGGGAGAEPRDEEFSMEKQKIFKIDQCDKTLFIMRAIGAQKSARRPHSYTGHTLAGGLELPLPPLPAITPNGRQPLGK